MAAGLNLRGGAVLALALALIGSACASKARPGVTTPAAMASAHAGDAGEDAGAEDEVATDEATDAPTAEADSASCPSDMALIEVTAPAPLRFCVDKYEASLVEVMADGNEQPFAHYLPVDGHEVRAVSVPKVFPQGYISEVQAQDACAASNKHLCKPDEWKTACMGPARTTFPYGDVRRPGVCADTGKSAVIAVFGAKAVAASTPYSPPPPPPPAAKPAGRRAHVTKGRAAQSTRPRPPRPGVKPAPPSKAVASAKRPTTRKPAPAKKSARPASVDPGVWARLNDPGLGQVEGALSRTGEHAQCMNAYGVFDMVGNLHEWVATEPALAHGTFAGGYYLDTTINGDGCLYRTQAHAHEYHDYSTGFRCCGSAR